VPRPARSILGPMRHVVAVVDDLMFLSRIREAAKRQGAEVQAVKTAAAAAAACREGCLVIFDLDSSRLPVMEAIAAVTDDSAVAGVELVGFYSHVETERARAALAAGCKEVMPRSRFVQELDRLLR
jgi:DNA-binding NarL/FixJ family response regulator